MRTGILLFIYFFINILFVWKYGAPYFSNQIFAPLLYVVFAGVVTYLLLSNKITYRFPHGSFKYIYFSYALVVAVIFTILMYQFDPNNIEVGRYWALHDWLIRLFSGEFPYASTARPSGFPFLFILALPFYVMGDIGLLQIFSFLLTAILLYYRFRKNGTLPIRMLKLFVLSVAFIFEVVVRSELVSNMTIVLAYLICCDKWLSKERLLNQIGFGLLGGFLLSTRSIVLVIYMLYVLLLIKENKANPFVFIFSMLIGFIATMIPFVVWNRDYFINYGPFAVQMLYAPTWFIILSIGLSLVWAIRLKKSNDVFYAIAVMLFLIVLGAFTLFVARLGLVNSVMNNQFDISYFCFPLPFVLMSLGATTERY